MSYVIRCKPLFTALTIWSLMCLVVVPLSAQNILVIPGKDVLRSLQFTGPLAAIICPVAAPLHFPVILGLAPSRPEVMLELTQPLENGESAHEGNCRQFTEIKKVDEEQEIREAWQEAFGFDVWYPYYKEKELEGWVRERFRVRILRLKGEPEFNAKGFTYIFKSNF